jgi:signal transduction histidine kinase
VLDLGLVPALQWQARHFSRHAGIPVSLKTVGDLDDIPEEQRTCIYRIVQESLTNAAKHGQAKAVEVTIRESNRLLSVRIQDDGVGFDPAAKRNGGGGLGLLGMEERVKELGGSLRIDSHPGDGTVLAVQLGLPEAATA